MIKTLAHVCLFSKDLNRSLDFYCGALGLRRHFDFLKDGELFGFYLQIDPHHFIEIFKAGPAEAAGSQRIHHLCLEVDDLQATLAELKARGTQLIDETPRRGAYGQVAFIHPKDALGTLIELVEE